MKKIFNFFGLYTKRDLEVVYANAIAHGKDMGHMSEEEFVKEGTSRSRKFIDSYIKFVKNKKCQ